MDGQSKPEIYLMFAEQDHDAMEWVEKRRIKRQTLKERRIAAQRADQQED